MAPKEFKYCNNILDTFIADIPSIIFYFQRPEPNSVQWVSLGLLERLFLCSKGIKVLLKRYQEENLLEFSMGILIRPIILDAMSSLSFIEILKRKGRDISHESKTKAIEEHSYTILSDGFKYNLDYAEALSEKQIISIEELHAYYNDHAINYPDFLYQPKGKNTRPKLTRASPPGAKKNFQILSDDKDLIALSHKLFDLYTFYSKYDHFGFMHYAIMNIESQHKEQRIIASLQIFVRHYYILADVFARITPGDEVAYNFYLQAKSVFENRYSGIELGND